MHQVEVRVRFQFLYQPIKLSQNRLLKILFLMIIRTKINKWDLIKLKSFCRAKDTINKMKRQPSEWEKIFANEATDKRFSSKMYQQFIQLTLRKQTAQSKNGQKTKETFLPKKPYRWPINITKRCSTSLIIREMQLKTTVRYITSHQSEWTLPEHL